MIRPNRLCRCHEVKRSYGQTSSPANSNNNNNNRSNAVTYQSGPTPQPAQAPPPLPPGPPPPPSSASNNNNSNNASGAGSASAPNPYANYGYPAAYAAAQQGQASGAAAQYPGYGYATTTAAPAGPQQPGAYPSYAQYPTYPGGLIPPPPPPPVPGYAAYYQPPPPQNGQAQPQAYPGYPQAYPGYPPAQQPPAAQAYPQQQQQQQPQQQGLPSPQGAPPYKRTRYDQQQQPPLPPGPAPLPAALPPVNANQPPRPQAPHYPPQPPPSRPFDRGPPPLPLSRPAGGPPLPPRGYPVDDRYHREPDYRDDYHRGPPPPPGYDRYGPPPPLPLPPPPGRYGHPLDDRRSLPPGGPPLRRDDRRDLGPPLPRPGGPGGRPPYGPRDGPRTPSASSSIAGRGGPRFADRGVRPVSGIPSARGGYAASPRRGGLSGGDRFAPISGPGDVGGAPKGPRGARGAQKKERRWGAAREKDGLGSKDKNGDGRTLTDFRIIGLEIPEIEWEWKGKIEEPKAAVDTAGEKEGPGNTKEGEEDNLDREEIATPVGSEEPTKKTKHGRDEDEGDEVQANGDDVTTATKKVKADTGEQVHLESVAQVKNEDEDQSGTKPTAGAEAQGGTATAEDVDIDGTQIKTEPADESVATQTSEKDVAPPFKLSAANSAPPLNTSTGATSERISAPTNRENSRLRIYFSSPVDSISTYIHTGGETTSVRGATVEPQPTSVRDTSMAPPSAEEKVAAVEGATTAESSEVTQEVFPETSEAAESGENVDGEAIPEPPLEGEVVVNDDASAGTAVEVVPDAKTAASATTEKSAAVTESNASYPPDPYSQGQPSIAGSAVGDEREVSPAPGMATGAIHHLAPPEPSADRISISYARNTRRMVLDADVVESVKIFRSEGRIELEVALRPAMLGEGENAILDEFRVCEGILIEALDREHDDYLVIDRPSLEAAWRAKEAVEEEAANEDAEEESDLDHLLPPLHYLLSAATTEGNGETASLIVKPGFTRDRITVIAHFDRLNPLTEARWVKTGEIDSWIVGLAAEKKEDQVSAWKGKITVADPDPAPTIQNALDAWASSSSIGSLGDRQAFVTGPMSDIDNVLEILLRLTRGDNRSHHNNSNSASSSSSGASVPVLAASLSAPYPDSQTQVSLAVLAMFRLSVQTAEKAGLDAQEVHRQVSEIVRGVPHHLQFKALDGMFLEHRKKVKVAAAATAAALKAAAMKEKAAAAAARAAELDASTKSTTAATTETPAVTAPETTAPASSGAK